MRNDVEKYEHLIRHSPLFSIDKQKEPNAYKNEAVKMVGYLYQYLLSINENKYIDYGIEIFDTANACIKNYNSEFGEFLNYFNSAMSRNYKRAYAKKIQEDVRGGIVISNEEQRLIRKLLKIADEKNLDVNSDSFCEIASLATGLSVGRIWELIQINNNATTISDVLTDENGEELSIFETEEFATFLPNQIEEDEKVKSILDVIETTFSERQNRQKPLLAKLITARLSNVIDSRFVPYFKAKAFYDDDIYLRSIEWGVPVTSKEIAGEMNLHESSVSRTAKQFFELLKEKVQNEQL